MPKEFQRENRYVVFKRSDMRKYLSQSERRQVEGLALHICLSREDDGKQPLNCLVIEKDWPEYEPTWKSIEARVTGTQPAQMAVAYLDLGTGGYMDIGTDLTDEALATLPKGRHMLGIVGTYGVDGYVPAQPAPSVPEGFNREDLEAVVDGLDGYEKTVNVGNVTGGGDDHLESTTAYAARFIRAMLARYPTRKARHQV